MKYMYKTPGNNSYVLSIPMNPCSNPSHIFEAFDTRCYFVVWITQWFDKNRNSLICLSIRLGQGSGPWGLDTVRPLGVIRLTPILLWPPVITKHQIPVVFAYCQLPTANYQWPNDQITSQSHLNSHTSLTP